MPLSSEMLEIVGFVRHKGTYIQSPMLAMQHRLRGSRIAGRYSRS